MVEKGGDRRSRFPEGGGGKTTPGIQPTRRWGAPPPLLLVVVGMGRGGGGEGRGSASDEVADTGGGGPTPPIPGKARGNGSPTAVESEWRRSAGETMEEAGHEGVVESGTDKGAGGVGMADVPKESDALGGRGGSSPSPLRSSKSSFFSSPPFLSWTVSTKCGGSQREMKGDGIHESGGESGGCGGVVGATALGISWRVERSGEGSSSFFSASGPTTATGMGSASLVSCVSWRSVRRVRSVSCGASDTVVVGRRRSGAAGGCLVVSSGASARVGECWTLAVGKRREAGGRRSGRVEESGKGGGPPPPPVVPAGAAINGEGGKGALCQTQWANAFTTS